MSILSRLLTLTAVAALMVSSLAQPPPLPRDLLEGSPAGRRLTGNTIIFCLDSRDPAYPVDRALAEAIAETLLLEPQFHLIESALVVEMEIETLYIELVDNCHVYLGFKLLSGVYADWLALTRAYYLTSYVMVVQNPDWDSLQDIPRDQAIGGVPGTAGDIRLISYLNTLPRDQRWPRHPRGSNEGTLQAVADGSLGGGLVWAPAFWKLRSENEAFADMHFFEVEGISEPIGVAGVLLSGNAYLRQALDTAIVALVQEGLIGTIVEEFDFPARQPELR